MTFILQLIQNKTFRHTGGLRHSSKRVSLTCLEGLELPELKEEDMPNIKTPANCKGL